jgi:hypothetical protein
MCEGNLNRKRELFTTRIFRWFVTFWMGTECVIKDSVRHAACIWVFKMRKEWLIIEMPCVPSFKHHCTVIWEQTFEDDIENRHLRMTFMRENSLKTSQKHSGKIQSSKITIFVTWWHYMIVNIFEIEIDCQIWDKRLVWDKMLDFLGT